MIDLRTLSHQDLPAITRVHVAAFPESALTRLGGEAVSRYYRWQLEGPHDCDAVGAFEGGVLVGFCFGGLFRGAMGGFLRRNARFLATRIALRPWLLFNRVVLDRVGTALKSFGNGRRPTPSVSRNGDLELRSRSYAILAIAIDPGQSRRGVGRVLMDHAERRARERGLARMHLTVDTSNSGAIEFYRRLGWRDRESSAPTGYMYRMLTD